MDRSPSGAWLPWTTVFPPTPGDPGDATPASSWTVAAYLHRSISLAVTLLQAIQSRHPSSNPAAAPASPSAALASASPLRPESLTPAALTEAILRWLRLGELASLAGIIQAMQLLDLAVRNMPPPFPRDLVLQLHQNIASAAQRQLLDRTSQDETLRRLWEIVDLVLAVIRGIIRFGLVADPRGFEAIDDYDCREWLKLNGASERSVDSAFLRALYDLAFAYEDGDVSRPRIAAGQALRGAVRAFFTYRGSFFWKMQAGMGDVVFAPFYEVLRRRGARVRFFHRLRRVRLAPAEELGPGERPFVRHLDFDVQADTLGGEDYRPLVDVRGLPCWPARPDYAQLVDGESLRARGIDFESHWDRRAVRRETRTVGDDFDAVILAVGLGEIPELGEELIARSPRYAEMVRRCKTVSTQALQLWMTAEMSELGWPAGPTNLSGFVEPFDTWADMSQLVAVESVTPPPKSIAYFCSVLPDPPPGTDVLRAEYPKERRAEVRRNAVTFLQRDVVHLWPRALDERRQFRWDVLHAAPGEGEAPAGESRLDGQFWTANVNPSDRYSLSLPGSLKHRVSPLDATFDNLTVAGDWTDCGFNEGCVEAAVMSGRLAAHAISRSPRLEDIVGFDHP